MPRGKKKVEVVQQSQIYGYLRVSTDDQNLDNNRDVIQQKKEDLGLIGPIEWIEEKISGTVHWKKRELGKLLDKFQQNDILIISELSRISRRALEIQEFISVANQKNVKIYSLDIPNLVLDGSMQSNMYISMLSMGAQLERENISTRTKTALAKRRSEGVKLGRPLGSKNKSLKLEPHKEQIKKKIMSGITLKRIAEDYDVSQQTMCNFVSHNKLKPSKSLEPRESNE